MNTDRVIKKKGQKEMNSSERHSNFKFTTMKCQLFLLTAI